MRDGLWDRIMGWENMEIRLEAIILTRVREHGGWNSAASVEMQILLENKIVQNDI